MGEVLTLDALRQRVRALQAHGKRIAFANGHFDLLHVGHLRYLRAARAEGDALIVAINDDNSVARLKGPGRPVVPAAERAELLAALEPVDFVVVFQGDSPAPLLAELRPNVHCKGTDYGSPERVPEHGVVSAYGGRTALVGDPKDHATSDLISKVKALPSSSPGRGKGGMRILLIRTSALGDVVHCLPVLTALRRHLPGAKIGWVVEGAMAPVLAGHPDLDELLVVRLRAWRKKPFSPETRREVAAFRDALDRFAPDVTLDLMGNHKAGFLSALTLCDRRIGPARSWRREPSSAFWISEPVEVRGTHAVDRALSLLDAFGIPPERADFGGDKIFRDEPEGVSLPEPDPPFLLIHPGAGWPSKRYPPARWGEVARRLRESTGLPTWVPVAPGEEGLAAEVEAAAGGTGGAVRTMPADLPTLAALLRRARLVMGGDSGPTHLAHALGTPVLMLMGPTDPARHGPYGAPERALWKLLPCSFCYRRFDETKACLLDIPADRVAGRAAELIDPVPPLPSAGGEGAL